MYSNRGGHRSHQSLSLPPSGGLPASGQRRVPSPAMSSQSSLTLPEGSKPSPRPPSPLRNTFTFDSSTGVDPADASFGSDDEQHPDRWRRSPSPTSSVSNLAASFVQRVNNFVGGITAPPSPLPSDAELEAEGERERERSRREAEAILIREAQQRRQVEDRVLAMMDSARSLPPPPSRSQTMPSTTPSPSSSHKDSSSWWQAAKHKLTPTKEKDPPTPAQQVIMEAKARDKKGKGRDDDPQGNVFQEQSPLQPPPQRKPAPPSPSSPTPSRPNLSTPNLSPGPIRMSDSLAGSPSRDPPPMYAQFNPQGTLDVPATLLAIARRFEKLEKWTIGHVRALEDRMNDVERWLVDKEKEKENGNGKPAGLSAINETPAYKEEMNDIRDEISELQGRVGELGREMAKMATSPSNLSLGPRPQTASVSMAPRQASTQLVHETADGPPVLPPLTQDLTGTPRHSRLSSTALDTTSPPLASTNRRQSGTKLPYPTGDYNSPGDAFSPPSSPPASLNSGVRKRGSISGLPTASSSISPLGSVFTSTPSLASNRPTSPPTSSPLPASLTRSPKVPSSRTESPTPANNGLPPPKPKANFRQSSVSPTPRKRYTVPLGGPIVAPPSPEDTTDPEPLKRVGTPKSFNRQLDTDDDDEDDGGETIGKSASARLQRSLATKRSTTSLSSVNSNTSDKGDTTSLSRGRGDFKVPASATTTTSNPIPIPASNAKKFRAQSAYGFSEMQAQNDKYRAERGDVSAGTSGSGSTQPLRLKMRTRSTERLGGSGGDKSGDDGVTTATGGKFVDPLLLRRQESRPIAMPKPVGKAGIGQLVAFFDKDKKDKA